MTAFVALLRAVNVGGTGKLPMATLKSLCEDAGFANVRTYIASGNVVFDSGLAAAKIKAALAARLQDYAGKPVGVLIRDASEMAAIVAANPFADQPGNRVMAIFLDDPPPEGALDAARHRTDEQLALGVREIYAFYPGGMGTSKLRIPAAATGTARNMNTIATLARMAAGS